MNFIEAIKELQAQNAILRAELNTSQKRCEQFSQAYDSLQLQLKELLRNRFGKKSERYIDPENPQLSLFDAPVLPTENEVEEASTPVAAHARKKKKKEKALPTRIEVIPVSEEDKQCKCGACKTVIGYEKKCMINHEPAILEIVEQRREIVACSRHCEGENAIITAPAPLHVLPKSKATESFLAFLIVSKIDDRQPLYHLEKQLAHRHNIDCSRQTMARWLIELAGPLQPIYNLLKDEIIGYDVASCDPTTLQVLHEPGRAAETKSYAYCMRGGPPGKEVILYDYNEKLHKLFVETWFAGFIGYLHVDGDNFFESIGETDDVTLSNCNTHARRKFEPISKSAKGSGIAKEAMRYYKSLYKIEREAKNNKLMPEARYALRLEKSKPLLEKFKAWLEEVYPTVLPQSPLGKAIYYSLKRWVGLTNFLKDGRLEIDNNLTEQEIKPFVISRKNFLFCDSVEGANALCLHFGLIRTAKKHG